MSVRSRVTEEGVMLQQRQTATRSIGHPDLTLRVTEIGDRSAVLDVLGAVHRSTVGALAAEVSDLRASLVVVDLSGVVLPNEWLPSGLAKAHAALIARKGRMRLVVDDDETFGLLYAAGFDRLSAVFVTRRCRDSPAARLYASRNRTSDRQRVIGSPRLA